MSGRPTRLWPSLAAAVAIHAAAIAWIAARPAPAAPPARRPPTTVRLVARTSPPAPAPEEPRRIAAARPAAPAQRERPAAQPPAPAAPEEARPPQPRRFAVSMDAVVPGNAGGVAMPVAPGPTAARGDPDAPAGAPAGDNVPFASRAADATEVDRLPRVLRQPSAAEMRAMYPETARRDGVEGDVRVEILVSAAGRVEEVRVVQPGGHGFDDVARTLVRRLAFVPAQRGGRPVPVWIPWTWKFRLDG